MYIVELTYPGTWLDYQDRDWCRKVENQVRSLDGALIDGALALAMFDAERAKPRQHGHGAETWALDSERRQKIEQAVRGRLGIEPHSVERWDEIRYLAEMEFKREQWASGRLPSSYDHRVIFLHARSFLYALDRLERCLAALAKEVRVPNAVGGAHSILQSSLPGLRGVRDSISHFDERSRGLERGRPLKLQPIMNQMVHAPAGGVLILESLNDNRFGSTMADGYYGEVEVSAATLAIATSCVQQVISAFSWKGPPQHTPY